MVEGYQIYQFYKFKKWNKTINIEIHNKLKINDSLDLSTNEICDDYFVSMELS